MRKDHVKKIIEQFLPKASSYALALTGEELSAQQLIIDAYTVFLMGNKDSLEAEEYELNTRMQKRDYRQFLLNEFLREIFELSVKRANLYYGHTQEGGAEYDSFFKLNLMKRGVLYLKEIIGFSVEELQEHFTMTRAQVIEIYYNAKHEVLSVQAEGSHSQQEVR